MLLTQRHGYGYGYGYGYRWQTRDTFQDQRLFFYMG